MKIFFKRNYNKAQFWLSKHPSIRALAFAVFICCFLIVISAEFINIVHDNVFISKSYLITELVICALLSSLVCVCFAFTNKKRLLEDFTKIQKAHRLDIQQKSKKINNLKRTNTKKNKVESNKNLRQRLKTKLISAMPPVVLDSKEVIAKSGIFFLCFFFSFFFITHELAPHYLHDTLATKTDNFSRKIYTISSNSLRYRECKVQVIFDKNINFRNYLCHVRSEDLGALQKGDTIFMNGTTSPFGVRITSYHIVRQNSSSHK